MSNLINSSIFLDALNKYTELKFEWDDENDCFLSDTSQVIYFEVREGDLYKFDLFKMQLDLKTGVVDDFLIAEQELLADIIDTINSEV